MVVVNSKMQVETTKRFVTVFENFLSLCKLENWPSHSSSIEEIKNAYRTAEFIEKCSNKLLEKQILDEFLSQIDSDNKNCVLNPVAFILKKIMSSEINLSMIDDALKTFVEIFNEKYLEECLALVIMEKASENIILKSFNNSNDCSVIKCTILLKCLSQDEASIEQFIESDKKDLVSTFLLCLTMNEIEYKRQMDRIKSVFIRALSDRSSKYKWLWRIILLENEEVLLKICKDDADIFRLVTNAILDCGKVLKENISTEFYYIDLSHRELVQLVECLCRDDEVKSVLKHAIRDEDKTFWDITFNKVQVK